MDEPGADGRSKCQWHHEGRTGEAVFPLIIHNNYSSNTCIQFIQKIQLHSFYWSKCATNFGMKNNTIKSVYEILFASIYYLFIFK